MEVKIGDIVQFRSASAGDKSAWQVIDMQDSGKVAVLEITTRIMKVSRVVDCERLKVLF